MKDCKATVQVERYSDNGVINFTVKIEGCSNSSGLFEYTALVENKNGIQGITKRVDWGHTNGSETVNVKHDLALGNGESITSVVIDSGSVKCNCID